MNDPMGRPKTPRPVGQIPAVDQLRGLAILMVFGYHALGFAHVPAWESWSGWFRSFDGSPWYLAIQPLFFGWSGVAVFFAVSGFCIHLSHRKSAQAGWRVFAWRRFWRIYPPYLVSLLIFAFIYPLTRLHFDGPHHGLFDWAQLGSHLLLIHNLDQRSFYGINGAFWSIAVEWQLYLIYPVLIWLVNRGGWRRTMYGIGALEVGLRCWMALAGEESSTGLMAVGTLPCWVAASPFVYWFSWAAGAWLADAFVSGEPLPFARQPAWLWAALFVASGFFRPLVAFAFLFAALTTVVALARLLQRPVEEGATPVFFGGTGARWARWLTAVGGVSYSLYLLHQPMLMMVQPALQRFLPMVAEQPAVLFLAMWAMGGMAFIFSKAFYRWVEAPGIKFGKSKFRLTAGILPLHRFP